MLLLLFLVEALNTAANCTVHRVKSNIYKHWWSEDLQQEKQRSIDSHHMWVGAGRPRSGPIFDIYKQDKYAYKLAIRKSKCDADFAITNDLHESLCMKNSDAFWKTWHSKFNTKCGRPKIIEGHIDPKEIADLFADYFNDTCKPNCIDFNENVRIKFHSEFKSYIGDYLCAGDFFSVEQVSKIICELKTGRAAGHDGLTAEHLIHSHQAAHLLITYLLNLMLLAGHVPTQFGIGVTFPIPKGSPGSKPATLDDFRGITVSPVISKILEKCLLENFEQYFRTSDNQFGFKKHLGCNHAIYSLRSVVEYFNDYGSTVNICSIDISKAFDKLNHFALFSKLLVKNVPINVVKLLLTWYTTSVAMVNWNGTLSKHYKLMAGVRQGGVLSPILFASFVDSLIDLISEHNLGCNFGTLCLGVLMYADDLILISASVCNLQLMINICVDELKNLDLKINVKKSKCIRIGKCFNNLCSNLVIEGNAVPWSNCLTYLGVTIKSCSKFTVDLKPARCKFYRAFNSLYSKIPKANEALIVSLVNTFCVPIIMYSMEALDLNISLLRSLDEPMYNAFGKIFKSFDRPTLRSCMYYMGVLPLRFTFFRRKLKFLANLSHSTNILITSLSGAFGQADRLGTCTKFEIYPDKDTNVGNLCWDVFEKSLTC